MTPHETDQRGTKRNKPRKTADFGAGFSQNSWGANIEAWYVRLRPSIPALSGRLAAAQRPISSRFVGGRTRGDAARGGGAAQRVLDTVDDEPQESDRHDCSDEAKRRT